MGATIRTPCIQPSYNSLLQESGKKIDDSPSPILAQKLRAMGLDAKVNYKFKVRHQIYSIITMKNNPTQLEIEMVEQHSKDIGIDISAALFDPPIDIKGYQFKIITKQGGKTFLGNVIAKHDIPQVSQQMAVGRRFFPVNDTNKVLLLAPWMFSSVGDMSKSFDYYKNEMIKCDIINVNGEYSMGEIIYTKSDQSMVIVLNQNENNCNNNNNNKNITNNDNNDNIDKSNYNKKRNVEELKIDDDILPPLKKQKMNQPNVFHQIKYITPLEDGRFGSIHIGNYNNDAVAIKVVNNDKDDIGDFDLDISYEQMLEHEIKILNNLDHSSIIQIISNFNYNGVIGYCMPLCDMTLYDMIGDEGFTRYESNQRNVPKKIILDLGAALKYMHQMGILHRDIKPENILYKEDPTHPDGGFFLWSDFGAAVDMNKIDSDEYKKSINSVVESIGTMPYICSKEITRFEFYRDNYSFGLVIWECFFGVINEENKVINYKAEWGNDDGKLNTWQLLLWQQVFDIQPQSFSIQFLIEKLVTLKCYQRYTMEQLMSHPLVSSWKLSTYPLKVSNPLSLLYKGSKSSPNEIKYYK